MSQPFNRFPQDFTSQSKGRPKNHRFSRAIWDGETMRIFKEVDGTVTKVYEAEVPSLVKYSSTGARWVDPGSGVEFSMVKSSGCGCKYKNLSLARIADPEN